MLKSSNVKAYRVKFKAPIVSLFLIFSFPFLPQFYSHSPTWWFGIRPFTTSSILLSIWGVFNIWWKMHISENLCMAFKNFYIRVTLSLTSVCLQFWSTFRLRQELTPCLALPSPSLRWVPSLFLSPSPLSLPLSFFLSFPLSPSLITEITLDVLFWCFLLSLFITSRRILHPSL